MDEWTCKDWINELRSNGQVPLANPPQSAHLYIYLYSRLWPTKSFQRGPFISANRAASRMRRRGMSNLDSLALVKQELFPLGPGESRSSRNWSTVKLGQKVSSPSGQRLGHNRFSKCGGSPGSGLVKCWEPPLSNLPPASQSALGPTDTKCGQQLWTRLESQLCLSDEEYDEACWYTPRFRFGTHAWMNKGSSEAISGAKQLQYLHIKVSESGEAHKLEPPICCRT